jgi:hypothetical protein
MPLLRLKDLIINTDHIVRADYHQGSISDAALTIHLSDIGDRESVHRNMVMLRGFDAQLMWSMLSQLATQVVPALPNKPKS